MPGAASCVGDLLEERGRSVRLDERQRRPELGRLDAPHARRARSDAAARSAIASAMNARGELRFVARRARRTRASRGSPRRRWPRARGRRRAPGARRASRRRCVRRPRCARRQVLARGVDDGPRGDVDGRAPRRRAVPSWPGSLRLRRQGRLYWRVAGGSACCVGRRVGRRVGGRVGWRRGRRQRRRRSAVRSRPCHPTSCAGARATGAAARAVAVLGLEHALRRSLDRVGETSQRWSRRSNTRAARRSPPARVRCTPSPARTRTILPSLVGQRRRVLASRRRRRACTRRRRSRRGCCSTTRRATALTCWTPASLRFSCRIGEPDPVDVPVVARTLEDRQHLLDLLLVLGLPRSHDDVDGGAVQSFAPMMNTTTSGSSCASSPRVGRVLGPVEELGRAQPARDARVVDGLHDAGCAGLLAERRPERPGERVAPDPEPRGDRRT